MTWRKVEGGGKSKMFEMPDRTTDGILTSTRLCDFFSCEADGEGAISFIPLAPSLFDA